MSRRLYTLCGADPQRVFSPHSWKTVFSLAHKGLDFEEIATPFTDIPRLEGGFSQTVPILNDNGHLVSDSFAIALYLEQAYPDRPSLFNGEGCKAVARLVEGFSQSVIHPAIMRIALLNIHGMLAEKDQAYFRESREAFLGASLEDVYGTRDAEMQTFAAKLQPLRHMLKFQPFIGGDNPLFADYIVFGAFQWLRITAGTSFLDRQDAVSQWFERCLDLHGGRGRTVTAA